MGRRPRQVVEEDMGKTALLFPGQASQYVGMGKDLYDHSPDVQRLYELASEEMGVDIARLSFDGPAEELKRTANTQPAILLHSLAVLTAAGSNLPEFDYAAGHSLGEYGALASCGAMSYDDAIRAVVKRASLMEAACQSNPGAMAAVMGLSHEKINEVCDLAGGVVVPANYNSAIQLVISGSVSAVEEAVRLAREMGAKRAVMLEVGGAFHSPLMESARVGLQEHLAQVAIETPTRPVVANVTGKPASDGEEIRSLLVKQVTAPVMWAQTMQYLKDNGVDTVIEVGPGTVLTGLAKRDMKPAESVSLDTLEHVRGLSGARVN